MASLFSTPKIPQSPPVPTIDDAQSLANARDRALRRSRASTLLTSENGLPNLGATLSPSATSGG